MPITISLITVTLIFQILSVMPDKLNNILFFEVKKKEGCIMLIISLALIFLLICFMIQGSFNLSINLFRINYYETHYLRHGNYLSNTHLAKNKKHG